LARSQNNFGRTRSICSLSGQLVFTTGCYWLDVDTGVTVVVQSWKYPALKLLASKSPELMPPVPAELPPQPC